VPGFWPYGGVGADLLVMHASAAGNQIFNSLHQMREPQRRDFERHLCIATLVADLGAVGPDRVSVTRRLRG
jgi:hypothetical protein